jgi:hypothetical protein
LFSNNSYGTAVIQDGDITGGNTFADEYWPSINIADNKINNFYMLIRGILMGEFRFDITGVYAYDEYTYHAFLREKMAVKKDPWVTAMHAGSPGHAQLSGKLLPNETEFYLMRLNKALNYMKEDIKAIRENNPSAIIVILGDHGPYLTGDGRPTLDDYSPQEITELMIRDRFGTLVAIHWPDRERAEKYDGELRVNQDIFPVVFAYLADSYEPLKLMIKEKKAILKNHAFLDNGVFVPAIK